MTTLLERCQVVAAKVQQLKVVQRNANQQRLVQERTREWKTCYDELRAISARVACLPLDVEAQKRVAGKRAQFKHNAAKVLERLKSNDDIAQLTSDASWTRLLASAEGLADEVQASGKLTWRSYVEGLGGVEGPSLLRSRAPSTPMNQSAIAAYQRSYEAYSYLAKQTLPQQADDLAQVSQLIAACRTEVAKITFDVSPEVQQFFQDIQSGSATLASLRPGVLEWLTENGQLERYRIRSAGQ